MALFTESRWSCIGATHKYVINMHSWTKNKYAQVELVSEMVLAVLAVESEDGLLVSTDEKTWRHIPAKKKGVKSSFQIWWKTWFWWHEYLHRSMTTSVWWFYQHKCCLIGMIGLLTWSLHLTTQHKGLDSGPFWKENVLISLSSVFLHPLAKKNKKR